MASEPQDCCSIQKKRQRAFENGEIWFPRADKLNDPFECNPYFHDFQYDEQEIEKAVNSLSARELETIRYRVGISDRAELLKILKTPNILNHNNCKRLTELPNEEGFQSAFEFLHQIVFVEYVKALFSNSILKIGVLSMTEDSFNLLMWAHYGGNSTGICIEFERNSNNVLGSINTRRVDYVASRPRVELHERKKCIEKIIYMKSHFWSYEKEWRTCQPEGDRAYPFPGNVRRILFGLNCNENTIELTKNIFGKGVEYENIILGNDFSIQSDHGIRHSISQVALSW